MKAMLFVAAMAASTLAQAQAPSGEAARGAALFTQHGCHACHGTVGHGAPYGPKLAPNPIPWEAFAHQVRQPRGSMPRYAPQFLGDRELADIFAYVASIPAGPKAGAIPLLKE